MNRILQIVVWAFFGTYLLFIYQLDPELVTVNDLLKALHAEQFGQTWAMAAMLGWGLDAMLPK